MFKKDIVAFFLKILSFGIRQYELDEILKTLGTSWDSALKDITSLKRIDAQVCQNCFNENFNNRRNCQICQLFSLIFHKCLLLLRGVPIAKIIGHQEFAGRKFLVNRHVLIPRQETEILVNVACRYIAQFGIKYIVELGVGSGCILLSIAARFSHILSLGIDISDKAINVAKFNRESDRSILVCQNWNNIDSLNCEMILSNPPYVANTDQIDESVRNYDPKKALFGGKDGLNCFRNIAKIDFPKARYMILEIGFGQFEQICQIFSNSWRLCESVCDDKCQRVLVFEKL